MEPITNKDLITGKVKRDDNRFLLVTYDDNQGNLSIKIDANQPIAYLKKDEHCQISVCEVRNKQHPKLWLLSGGYLLFNEKDELAIGLRDDKGADPNCWTNIAAGRCDRSLEEHCLEELESEALLFGKDGLSWERLIFNDNHQLPMPKNCKKLLLNLGIKVSSSYCKIPTKSYDLSQMQTILIDECGICKSNKGLVWLDYSNQTIEIRFAIQTDLSNRETILLFGEGSGKAKWATKNWLLEQNLRSPQTLTPFLRWVCNKNS